MKTVNIKIEYDDSGFTIVLDDGEQVFTTTTTTPQKTLLDLIRKAKITGKRGRPVGSKSNKNRKKQEEYEIPF